MEKIAKLESDVKHIQSDITEIKGDLRSHFRLTIGGVVVLGGVFVGGYLSLMATITELTAALLSK